ncbi:MAG: cation-translocating P-type ATPase [Bryobacteraceae bacterium]|nr:cation-translocating P-type ATPase [Bryobacteraceae bacterium]
MAKNEKPCTLKIGGMDCAEEVSILKREVGPLVGGEQHLSFDILNGKMTVLPTATPTDPDDIIRAVRKTGMTAAISVTAATEPGRASWWVRHGRTALTLASGLLTVVAFSLHYALAGGWAEVLGSEGLGNSHAVPLPARVLYLLAVLAGLYLVLPKALFSLRRARPDMNLLMTIAVCGAIGIGEWFEAATVAFLFALSLTLESWSVARARRAIEKLLDLAPAVVRVIQPDGIIQEIPATAATTGTIFVVRPGERIALDGEVVKGTSDVNQAPITGESLPVTKQPRAEVFAGTVNGTGTLEVRSTKATGDTTLAHIIRLVGEAHQNRAPSEQWVDRFARFYTPAVMAAAVVVLAVPVLILGKPFEPWLYQALVLLVIACPCALVISTPVSVVAALAAAARNGVLVKGGAHMETPGRLKAIAMDKTGTLTEGRPAVVQVVGMNGHSESELLERAAAMEMHSDHPLAKAIVEHAQAAGLRPQPAEQFSTTPGKGATARWNGKDYWLGSHRLLEERGQETPAVHQKIEALARMGRTVVVFGNETHVCGFIALADRIRPESKATVAQLRQAGVEHIVMLTGDNRGTAEVIGRETGVAEIRAELLPAGKLDAIGRLVEQYKDVAMIGDGINDAPALSRATLGIAMGAAGSDTAMEAADVALMSGDLSKVPWLIRHSRRMMAIIRTNIMLSLTVKAMFVVLTMLGHASLWAAIAADMGVSLLVIFNALRLLGDSPGRPIEEGDQFKGWGA